MLKSSNVVLAEDVCNNFSTTSTSIDLVMHCGSRVIGIVCFLNRSTTIDKEMLGIPVIALVREPMPEWEQENSEVVDDIKAGNVVWKPKETENWAKLMAETKIAFFVQGSLFLKEVLKNGKN